MSKKKKPFRVNETVLYTGTFHKGLKDEEGKIEEVKQSFDKQTYYYYVTFKNHRNILCYNSELSHPSKLHKVLG